MNDHPPGDRPPGDHPPGDHPPSDHPLGLDSFGIGAAPEGLTARAGMPLQPGMPVAEKLALEDAMRQVHDPEIPVNIYDLGLIYELDIHDDGSVAIEMTLTAPACPVAGEMPQQVADAVAGTDGVGEVQVTLTWDPPWTPERMSEDAKLALGMF